MPFFADNPQLRQDYERWSTLRYPPERLPSFGHSPPNEATAPVQGGETSLGIRGLTAVIPTWIPPFPLGHLHNGDRCEHHVNVRVATATGTQLYLGRRGTR